MVGFHHDVLRHLNQEFLGAIHGDGRCDVLIALQNGLRRGRGDLPCVLPYVATPKGLAVVAVCAPLSNVFSRTAVMKPAPKILRK